MRVPRPNEIGFGVACHARTLWRKNRSETKAVPTMGDSESDVVPNNDAAPPLLTRVLLLVHYTTGRYFGEVLTREVSEQTPDRF